MCLPVSSFSLSEGIFWEIECHLARSDDITFCEKEEQNMY